jgi:transposase
VEEEQEEPNPTTTTAIGIDLGIKTLATLSDGMTFDNPRPFKHASARLRRLERQKSRRKKGGQIKRQLLYTSKREGTFLVMIDRFYPSSKTCSSCGTVRSELGLDERVFVCLDCGYVADRDYNAAKNIVQEALRSTGSSSGIYAYGETSSGRLIGVGETGLVEVGTTLHSGSAMNV